MDAGVVAAWVSNGIAAVALTSSVISARTSKEARSAAERSERRAASVAKSVERMADALDVIGAGKGRSEVHQPFSIEYGAAEGSFELRNISTMTLTGVTVALAGRAPRNLLPVDETLKPLRSLIFYSHGQGWQVPPNSIEVFSDQTGAVSVPMPHSTRRSLTAAEQTLENEISSALGDSFGALHWGPPPKSQEEDRLLTVFLLKQLTGEQAQKADYVARLSRCRLIARYATLGERIRTDDGDIVITGPLNRT